MNVNCVHKVISVLKDLFKFKSDKDHSNNVSIQSTETETATDTTTETTTETITLNQDETIESLVKIGDKNKQLGNYSKALECYNNAIQIASDDFNLYLKRANLRYYSLYDYEGAIEDYNLVIENYQSLQTDIKNEKFSFFDDFSYDSFYELLLNRGASKLSTNDYEGAVEDFSILIDKYPFLPKAYYNRGNARRDRKEYEAAIPDYKKILEIEPYDEIAYYNLSLCYSKLNNFSETINAVNCAIEKGLNGLSDSYFLRGHAKYHLKDYLGAIEDFSQAIKSDEETVYVPCDSSQRQEGIIDSETYLYRGLAKFHISDYQGAINDLNITIQHSTDNKKAYFYRGSSKLKLGDISNGTLDIEKSKSHGFTANE